MKGHWGWAAWEQDEGHGSMVELTWVSQILLEDEYFASDIFRQDSDQDSHDALRDKVRVEPMSSTHVYISLLAS